jgi:hypothetical protein
VGAHRQEIVEAIMHMIPYVGFVKVQQAMALAEEVFKRMSEKSRLLSDPPPKSPILGDFKRGLVRKSPRMGGWGASVRIL